MKKKTLMIVGALLAFGLLAGCGNEEDVKVVNKLPQKQQETSGETTGEPAEKEESLSGFIYEAEEGEKSISLAVDRTMAQVTKTLGEPSGYFESESCAFHGLDKTYTYSHFRIETYPDGENDRISSIVLLDDITETKEGIAIGMTKEKVEESYGKDGEEGEGTLTYEKEGSTLVFVFENGKVISIQYNSKKAQEAQQ